MENIILKNVVPHAFDGVSDLPSDLWGKEVKLPRGETYLIESDSGGGKSSLCHYLIGYRCDYNGQILFDSEDIRRFSRSRWMDVRQSHISHLFQELRLFPELTAWENVMLKNQITATLTSTAIADAFARLGLKDKCHVPCAHLSLGQQQRVAAIRAVAQPFDFMLIDEPVSHLDDYNAHVLGEFLSETCLERNASLVVMSIGKHPKLTYTHTIRL